MHTNVAINATVHLVNSQLSNDIKKQILNMNKRMKVRRKKLKPLTENVLLPELVQKSTHSYRITSFTSMKHIFLGLVTVLHVLGLATCIGKFKISSLFRFSTTFVKIYLVSSQHLFSCNFLIYWHLYFA